MTKTETTITEAFAELKIIGKRIEKKQEFVRSHLMRPAARVDPLKDSGGQVQVVRSELQAITDLGQRQVAILRAIETANAQTTIRVGDAERTVADWLVWRRQVAPVRVQFLQDITKRIDGARSQIARQGGVLTDQSTRDQDITVNVQEVELHKEIEDLLTTVEALDGQLSLKNATVRVTY